MNRIGGVERNPVGAAMDKSASYLIQLAEERARDLGHPQASFQHLMLAVLDRYLPMVESMAAEVDWQQYREDLEGRLRAGAPSGDRSMEEIVGLARSLAEAEGVAEIRLRHLCAAALQAAGMPTGPGGQAAGEGGAQEATAPTGQQAATKGVEAAGETEEGEGGEPTEEQGEAASPSGSPGLEQYMRRKGQGGDRSTATLDQYGVDLTEKARRGELAPVVGRDREIDAMIEILCRSYKRNPLLVGPAGVGKTAIVEGLAQRIVAGDVPEDLRDARIVMLQPTVVMQGVRTASDLEERIEAIVSDASKPGVLLFIDEFHMIVGAAGVPGISDLAQRLKPALARGQIACIGATTEHEFRQYIQKDRALERRFHPLRVDELNAEDTLVIVQRLAVKWEGERGVQVEVSLLSEIVDLSDRYIRNRRFPDKAIELLDTAIAAAQASCCPALDRQTVHRVISNLIGAPVGEDEQQLAGRLRTLEEHLNSAVLGQEEAASLVATHLSVTTRGFDLDPQRPNGVFLFAGPPGVGKTTMAREIARFLFDSPDKILELEMSEFQDHHTVYKLIGSPPGYVGFDEGGRLEWVNDNPYSVVALDNIEYAHPDVLALFEQVFSQGTISTMRGERIIFSDVIFVMTCNLQTRRQPSIGFGQTTRDEGLERQLRQVVREDLMQCVDAVCAFYPLSEETVQEIVRRILVPQVCEKAAERGIKLTVGEDVIAHVAAEGFSPTQGASRLGRVVETALMRPVLHASDAASTERRAEGVALAARMEDGRVKVEAENQGPEGPQSS